MLTAETITKITEDLQKYRRLSVINSLDFFARNIYFMELISSKVKMYVCEIAY